MTIERRMFPMVVAAVMPFSMALPSIAEAKSKIYKNWRGTAINGYDPVAFHREDKPINGSREFELKWKDAKWRCARLENRDLFEADPEICAPLRRVLSLGRL
ncbi:MAG: hypothetical protein PVH42_14615 [Desulfobacterales bacterium]